MVKNKVKAITILGCFLVSLFLTVAARSEEVPQVPASPAVEVPQAPASPVAQALEYVTLSGNVSFDKYQGGEIVVQINKGDTTYGTKEFAVVDSQTIAQPGSYSLSVEKNSGEVFVEAFILKKDSATGEYFAWGGYQYNPLIVGAEGKNNIDIKLSIMSPANKMTDYQGETASIKGKIIFAGYKGGPIIINATSNKGGLPDVNSVTLSAPGEYDLKVPVNTGTIYITAVNGDENTRGSQKAIGSYGKPLVVGSAGIEGVDIKLYEDISSGINNYSTVTISGRVIFDNYASGTIFIGAGQVEFERPNLNVMEVSAPGEYTLKVPKNIGPVYVTATTGDTIAAYKNNPILVGDTDLSGVDITF
ncbi:MAG: hypothetical protein WCY09_01675 [Candidatus Omnitrophota bacterium]